MKTGAVIGVDEDMEEDIEWVPQVEIQLGRGLTKEKMCGKDYLEEGDTYALWHRPSLDSEEQHKIFMVVEDDMDVLLFDIEGTPLTVLNGREPSVGRQGKVAFLAQLRAAEYGVPVDTTGEAGAKDITGDSVAADEETAVVEPDKATAVTTLEEGTRVHITDPRVGTYGVLVGPTTTAKADGKLRQWLAYDDGDTQEEEITELALGLSSGKIVVQPALVDYVDGGMVQDQPASPAIRFTCVKNGRQKTASASGVLLGKHPGKVFGEDLFCSHSSINTPTAAPKTRSSKPKRIGLETFNFKDIVKYTGPDSRPTGGRTPIHGVVFGCTFKDKLEKTGEAAGEQGRKFLVVYDQEPDSAEKFSVQAWGNWSRIPAPDETVHPSEAACKCLQITEEQVPSP